jgi:hypothetical protein
MTESTLRAQGTSIAPKSRDAGCNFANVHDMMVTILSCIGVLVLAAAALAFFMGYLGST